MFLINPNEGVTKKITEKYSLTYVSHQEIGGNISASIDKITLGINGKLDNTNTISKEVTTEYTVTESNLQIEEFYLDFFDDYPIESVLSNTNNIVPNRIGKGIIETSILPISDSFFRYKRFNVNN